MLPTMILEPLTITKEKLRRFKSWSRIDDDMQLEQQHLRIIQQNRRNDYVINKKYLK